jgi:hypothetical protein
VFLFLIKDHDMNTYGEVEVLLHEIMEVGDQLHFCPFDPQKKKSSGGHWIGACVGPRTSLGTARERPLISSGY